MTSVLEKKSERRKIPILDLDAYSPDEVTDRIMQVGVKKIRFPGVITFALGMLGGVFISLGALYQLTIMANPAVSGSVAAIAGPLFYAMGYIIAFTAGAEVFTTNNLAVMGMADGKIGPWELTRNWIIVFIANGTGAILTVVLFLFSGQVSMFNGLLIDVVLQYNSTKLSYTAAQMLVLGIFGNLLICSGAWLAMAGRSVTDKFLALLLPLSAVPAMGFQHGTGNMFHLFLSLFLLPEAQGLDLATDITVFKTTANLVLVGLGNIIGGGVFIALTYYFVYVRSKW